MPMGVGAPTGAMGVGAPTGAMDVGTAPCAAPRGSAASAMNLGPAAGAMGVGTAPRAAPRGSAASAMGMGPAAGAMGVGTAPRTAPRGSAASAHSMGVHSGAPGPRAHRTPAPCLVTTAAISGLTTAAAGDGRDSIMGPLVPFLGRLARIRDGFSLLLGWINLIAASPKQAYQDGSQGNIRAHHWIS